MQSEAKHIESTKLDAEGYKAHACSAMDIERFENTMGARWEELTFPVGDKRRVETWLLLPGGKWELTWVR